MKLRIVSLLPSATEVVCAIPDGMEMLVGRSHECDYPAEVKRLPVLTAARTCMTTSAEVDAQVRAALGAGQSLYTLDEALLAELRPDVIITQDLCQVCSVDLAAVARAAARMSPKPAVVSLNPTTVEGVFDDVLTVGRALGLEDAAQRTLVQLRERMYSAGEFVNPYADGPSVAFLEWTDPIFVGGHWTPQLIERAGGRHPLNPTRPVSESAGAAEGPIGQTQRAAGKSVTVPPEVLSATRPERIVICPCGLDLDQTRRQAQALLGQRWFADLPAVRAGNVALVDGNQMFNRPGPRLVDAFCWLVGWLNDRPELTPENFPWESLAAR
jgi:iron complex transport system substrate-binding protein